MNRRYLELLKKYCKNLEILELIDLAVLDEQDLREQYFRREGKYPADERKVHQKIKYDLIDTAEAIESIASMKKED